MNPVAGSSSYFDAFVYLRDQNNRKLIVLTPIVVTMLIASVLCLVCGYNKNIKRFVF